MTNDLLRLCSAGESCDQLLANPHLADAETAYLNLIEKAKATKHVDQFIVSKAVLGLLLNYLLHRDIHRAHALWISTIEGPRESFYLGFGIHGLENDAVGDHDTALYLMISAVIHAEAEGNPKSALRAVDGYMKKAHTHAAKREPSMTPSVLRTWRFALHRAVGGPQIPVSALKAWSRACEGHPGDIEQMLDLPVPAPWTAPERDLVVMKPDGTYDIEAPDGTRRKGFWARLFGR